MKRVLLMALSACLMWAVVAPIASVEAQAQTGTQFYMEYRKAFDAAKKVEDLFPYMAAKTKAEVNSTPAKERADMFELIKMMGTVTNVKVTKETRAGEGATLNVDALDSEKKATKGTITLVREGGAWKLAGESWSNQ